MCGRDKEQAYKLSKLLGFFSVSVNFSNVLYSIFIYACHVGVDVCVCVCVCVRLCQV